MLAKLRKFKKLNYRGDSLVEVLISIVVLAIVLTAAYALSTHSLGTGVDAQNRSKALSIANGQVALLQNAEQGLSTGISTYSHEGGAFCIDSKGSIHKPTDSGSPCTQGNFTYTVNYNTQTQVYTVTTKWAANSLSIYYKAASQFTSIDVCPPPAGPAGIQSTVPNGLHLLNGQCVKGNTVSDPPPDSGGTTTTTTGGPPHCVITNIDPPYGDCANGHCGSITTPGGCNNWNGGGSQVQEQCNGCLCTLTLYDWNYSGTSSDTKTYVKTPPACDPALNTVFPQPTFYTGDPTTNPCYPQIGDPPDNCHDASNCADLGLVGDMSGNDYSTCKNPPPPPPTQSTPTPTDPNNPGGCVPSPSNDYNCNPTPPSPQTACNNGAINPPDCNSCDSGATWDGTVCTESVDGGGSCFVAGTMVSTPFGPRPIETIMPGDMVISWDFKIHALTASHVLESLKHSSSPTLILMTDRGKSVTTTAVHRFWTGSEWLTAGQMNIGSTVVDEAGQLEHIVSIQSGPSVDTYNIHVANESHDYYANQLLVHNMKPGL